MPKRTQPLRIFLVGFIVLSGLFTSQTMAHAGWWEDYKNGIETFTNLPQEVNELKQGYDQALNKLDQAQSNIEAYRTENARLAEQNALLAQTVEQLKQSEADRAQSARFWKGLVFTAIGIVVLFFISTRLIRFGLRRR
ncbi:hypothetical protein QCD85_03845 [Paenibacillus sp. PsM32]|uniref:Uncharacterized protein n=1 Tax=Paenibacillus kyungheensis TaxID=1452732 RepID=A0AAX3M4A8_9BACL|nr:MULTISPECIES: hypothetical protein [Paenibacillus]MDN4617211.1 hypothetical protein [Paenibacillus sp. PsM32]MDQ1232942.1 FtsZ-binding cell division protein ZapB [Paenibacillus sp. SORGH_AS_0306]MDR6109988.1 FtsZ-binding cell division protein ZapB [Paenibacillus sp. SORGH_AS_0338]WCT56967.1 hypothetical protein PQ456_05445 [Paenibacillus kyungheensis]WDF49940.1 hypothetical protein PQ460_18380 [Paenibacillus sp. KACC 21273]